jgi:SNF2 family DNA or RNA helicase
MDDNNLVLEFPTKIVYPDINLPLYDYQREGIEHMYNLVTKGNGAILAHEMGLVCVIFSKYSFSLGKTAQTIVVLNAIYPYMPQNAKFLILGPKNTLSVWQDELEKWKVKENPLKHRLVTIESTEGMEMERQWMYRKNEIKHWSQTDENIIIMSYDFFKMCVADVDTQPIPKGKKKLEKKTFVTHKYVVEMRRLLCDLPLVAVFDEAHMLKNNETGLYNCVELIATPSRICLSGTPIQNKPEEFYTLVNFVNSDGILGTRGAFKTRFVNPIKRGLHPDADPADVSRMKVLCRALYMRIKPVLHRMTMLTADIVNKIPPKHEYIVQLVSTKLQDQLYRLYLTTQVSGEEMEEKNHFQMLVHWHILSRICMHPCLLLTTNDNWYDNLVTTDHLSMEESGKIFMMLLMLKWFNDHEEKCIIFSQRTECLDCIEKFLRQGFIKMIVKDNHKKDAIRKYYNFSRIDGETSFSERSSIVKDFNRPNETWESPSTIKLLLSTTRSGGVGTTLTAANRVIICDISWNPCIDQQAIGRVFRLGQTRETHIYRFIVAGTMDYSIYLRTVVKQATASRLVDNKTIVRTDTAESPESLYEYNPKFIGCVPIVSDTKDEVLKMMAKTGWVVEIAEHDTMLIEGEYITPQEEEESELVQFENISAHTRSKTKLPSKLTPSYYRTLLTTKLIMDCTFEDLAFPELQQYVQKCDSYIPNILEEMQNVLFNSSDTIKAIIKYNNDQIAQYREIINIDD